MPWKSGRAAGTFTSLLSLAGYLGGVWPADLWLALNKVGLLRGLICLPSNASIDTAICRKSPDCTSVSDAPLLSCVDRMGSSNENSLYNRSDGSHDMSNELLTVPLLSQVLLPNYSMEGDEDHKTTENGL